jgi:hypothetical protein
VRFDDTPVLTAGGQAKRTRAFFAGRNEWCLQVVLTTTGNSTDADNFFGFSAAARDGRDRLDLVEPPVVPGQRNLYLWHDDWQDEQYQYASDIRRTFREVNMFHLGISPGAGRYVRGTEIRFKGMEKLSGLQVFVGGPDTLIPVQPATVLPVAGADQTVYRTVFVSAERDFLRRFPTDYLLDSPYPNPLRGAVAIEYTLPYRWEKGGRMDDESHIVLVRIHDARGQVVRELVRRPQRPGRHVVMWDGRSNAGGRVAGGTYFVNLSAGSFRSVKRLVVMH